MKSVFKVSGVLAAVLITTVVLSACHGPRGWNNTEKRMDYAAYFIAGELDFDDAQKSQLESMKDEIALKMKEHQAEREAQKQYVASLVRTNELTEEAIDEIFAKHQQHVEEMKPFIKEKILEFNAMLNNTQRDKVADFIEKGGQHGKF